VTAADSPPTSTGITQSFDLIADLPAEVRDGWPASADGVRRAEPVDGRDRPGDGWDRQGDGWDRRARIWLTALVGGVFAAYATYALARHATFRTTGFDLGIFDQVIRDYAHFRAPVVPIKGPGYNLLGDHFHPLIAVLAPLYWIWDDPRMLLIAQALLFAVSIVPVARFTARRFGSRTALWVGLIYGISWPLQRAVQFDFHEIALAVPLIAVLLDALDRRRLRTVVVCCLLLLGIREDMGALVLLVGVLVVLPGTGTRSARGRSARGRSARGADRSDEVVPGPWERRRLPAGLGLMVLGLSGYEFATAFAIPAMASNGEFVYWTFPALGPDLPSAVRFALSHPWQVLVLFVTPQMKANTLLAMVRPTAFLALGSRYLVLGVPFVAERMLNSRPQLWDTGFHYTSVIAPILVLSAVDTMHRLVLLLRRRDARLLPAGRRPAGLDGPAGRLLDRVLPAGSADRLGRAGAGLVTVWLAWCLGVVGQGLATRSIDYPVNRLWSGTLWGVDDRIRAIRATLPLIPAHECVEVDNQISPHLTPRDYVTQVTQSQGLATWVLIDVSQKETGWLTPKPVDAMIVTVRAGYRVVSVKGPIVLLHRDQSVDPRCTVVP
jgi:hypothetical protein